jgi:hypothetical protein
MFSLLVRIGSLHLANAIMAEEGTKVPCTASCDLNSRELRLNLTDDPLTSNAIVTGEDVLDVFWT